MNIAITGGSGFVGTSLARVLLSDGHNVTVYDRVPPKFSDDHMKFIPVNFSSESVPGSIAHHDAIVHLAGASIYNRWTLAYKQEILTSRTKSTKSIVEACAVTEQKPKVLVCASAIGYYGDKGDLEITEDSLPQPTGVDFLSDVCVAWESEAQKIEALGIRRVSIRTAIVLGPGGGMMSKLIPLFRWGLGGKLGTGKQWFSWIHIDDLVPIYYEAITNNKLSGPVNASAPEPVTNKVFTQLLAAALHRFAPWVIPKFVLRIVLGEFAQAVLVSVKAVPAKIIDTGFIFRYPTMRAAIAAFHLKD